MADYDRAIELDPDYAEVYYDRGVTYNSLGDKGKARRDYLNAQKLAKRSGDNWILRLSDKKLSELDNENNNNS